MAQYEVTLRDYWRILRRRKGVVTFAAFLLGFFSFVLAQIWQPIPEYTANAKIQIESNQSIASLTMESYGDRSMPTGSWLGLLGQMRGRALSSVNLTARGSYGAENIADPLAGGSDKSLENLADPAFFLPAIRSLTKL